MDKAQVLAGIKAGGLVPVIRTPTAEDALAISEALQAASLASLEITLTIPNALEVIRTLSKRFGDKLLVGAGTVLDATAAAACIDAGATFIVSPGLDVETVAYCRKAGVAVLPGALTPTEIIAAWKAGADIVKVFPASAVGGAAYLKAVKGPLPHIEMLPTGGVSVETAASFIKAGACALGVGGDLVDLEALRAGRGEQIAEKARAYIEIVRKARG
jgi:2-dehydro-3-deoxyphosphogluconate aldolase/(4S)-4-hydroxy-2-oxoglutarate aldolase